MTPAEAIRPRWRGGTGFFEIWFLVVFDPRAGRAWWLRYTTFAPAAGAAGRPRATLWAAAFAAGGPAATAKAVHPVEAYAVEGERIRIGDAQLDAHGARGRVATARHTFEWALAWTPPEHPERRGSRLLEALPLPTRVVHAGSALACSGWIAVDGVRHQLAGAPAVHKHIWGTRRVEELLWLHCPRFAEDPTATVEATAVRLRRRIAGRIESPWVTPVWARTADGVVDGCSLWRSLKNHVERRGTYDVVFHAGTPRHWVRAHASCDPATLAGWVYRDPAGWDVHVAQSDVATCTLELLERPHPLAPWTPVRRLVAPEGAALEFHAPEPLPGVTYAGWD